MDRERFVIGDAVWEKIAPLLPGKKSDRGVTAKDNRLFLEAVLWRVRAGLPWRDLPPSSAIGTLCPSGSAVGYGGGFLTAYSGPYPESRISNTP